MSLSGAYFRDLPEYDVSRIAKAGEVSHTDDGEYLIVGLGAERRHPESRARRSGDGGGR